MSICAFFHIAFRSSFSSSENECIVMYLCSTVYVSLWENFAFGWVRDFWNCFRPVSISISCLQSLHKVWSKLVAVRVANAAVVVGEKEETFVHSLAPFLEASKQAIPSRFLFWKQINTQTFPHQIAHWDQDQLSWVFLRSPCIKTWSPNMKVSILKYAQK